MTIDVKDAKPIEAPPSAFGQHEQLCLKAIDLLIRLVEASDAGSDTYDVRDIVEKARALLGLPSRFAA